MNSNNIDLEELFRRISSPRTSEVFKALRHATTENLASTFRASWTELVEVETDMDGQHNSQSNQQ
jgi:hypothetical protein